MGKPEVLEIIDMGKDRADFVLTRNDTIGVDKYLRRREKVKNGATLEGLSITAIPKNVVNLVFRLLGDSMSKITGIKI